MDSGMTADLDGFITPHGKIGETAEGRKDTHTLTKKKKKKVGIKYWKLDQGSSLIIEYAR